MSEMSVGSVRLPRLGGARLGVNIAREAVFRLLGKLETGSLTVHEGSQSYRFGVAHGPRAEVHVHDRAVYSQMAMGGSIAAGETYMRGYWSTPDIIQVTRLFCANMRVLERFDASQSLWVRLGLRVAHFFNRNTRSGSRDNIGAHYDLGNDFFALFLDPSMMYSSALFTDPAQSLECASREKLDELCRQLELQPDDHLLEIGTGWGGMAVHAARYYGCRVTTTTISREQFDYARERVRQEGLQDRVTVLCQDYRELRGRYDKLVSIEMIEAVGHEFYGEYFRTCSALLQPGGKMVIQAITMTDQRYEQARDSVDFIKRYIFPGGCLPSVAVIAQHLASDTDMQMVHLRDITQDYAITLAHWRERFLAQLQEVRSMGFSDEFIRMWEYYLAYCEGGFRERVIGTVQLAFAKPAYRFAAPGPEI
ncbi:MAG: SAM-dependent methyltransferase [Halioglobus sp.]|nr:SAM-dependent methyltransferase [Halioglobus sp.]|tara:strand:- start:2700 stop:3965 length:1266 start_codon:yes stop_codon:yes gene_type:complete